MNAGTMYNWRVKAVLNALARAGKAEGPLTVRDLTSLGHLDQYHYLGTTACDHVATLLGISANSSVLDIGSGIGGPARYLSTQTGCSVVGVELQSELSQAAAELTARVDGLAERCSFVTGDFCDAALQLPNQSFDHFISLLVFLHVPDRKLLLNRCHSHLRPGGSFVIEDFCQQAPFTAEESHVLSDLVKAPTVTSTAQYLKDLKAAGFVDLEAVSMSEQWKEWTAARHALYLQSEEETVALHGRDLFESRVLFYRAIDKLFAGGNLGGVRISGRRPGPCEQALSTGRNRLKLEHASGESAVNVVEGGAGVFHSARAAAGLSAAGTTTTAAQALSASAATQPKFPFAATVPHDSLQYHFFFEGLFIALRVFHTKSLQHHSAWMFDASQPEQGAVELLNSEQPMTQGDQAELHLASTELEVVDAAAGATLRLRPSSPAAAAMLKAAGVGAGASGAPELTISVAHREAFGWLPAGQESSGNAVIHRPNLDASVSWCGQQLRGRGYSKRYYGEYGDFWGYRFIQGFAVADKGSLSSALASFEPAAIVWNADATFGDDKYNYWKLMRPGSSELVESLPADTWQQDACGYALIDGVRHTTEIVEIAKWSTVITNQSRDMASKMENRLCRLTVKCGEDEVYEGLAYNERCFGSLG